MILVLITLGEYPCDCALFAYKPAMRAKASKASESLRETSASKLDSMRPPVPCPTAFAPKPLATWLTSVVEHPPEFDRRLRKIIQRNQARITTTLKRSPCSTPRHVLFPQCLCTFKEVSLILEVKILPHATVSSQSNFLSLF